MASGNGVLASSMRLLERPPGEVARLLAIRHLVEWNRARERLDNSSDVEALHDFRVTLRRLRSLSRALRSPSDPLLPRRLRRRLRGMAEATGESRDLEVQEGWVRAQISSLPARQRAGIRRMLSVLDTRRRVANERLRRRLAKRFGPLEERLRATLVEGKGPDVAQPPAELPSAGTLVGEAVLRWTGSLESQLGTVHTVADDRAAHTARIAVKRLRYLLEPFQAERSAIAPALTGLKQLQDLLGDLHDSHRIAGELRQAFLGAAVAHAEWRWDDVLPWTGPVTEAKPSTGPDPRAGLVALARGLGTRGAELFSRLKSDWLEGGAAARLCAQLRAIAEQAATAHRPGIEIERKYLLSALPPHAVSFPAEEI